MRTFVLLGSILVSAATIQAQGVALDPAHGHPSNVNAVMRRESVFARLLAARIADSLNVQGVPSVITANDSIDLASAERVGRAKAAGATFVVILHSETSTLLAAGERGKLIGDTSDVPFKRVAERLKSTLEPILGGDLRVIHVPNLTAIRRFGTPGIVIKLGNNDDAADMARLSADPMLGRLAGAITQGIR